jgi:hypothetical protein
MLTSVAIDDGGGVHVVTNALNPALVDIGRLP